MTASPMKIFICVFSICFACVLAGAFLSTRQITSAITTASLSAVFSAAILTPLLMNIFNGYESVIKKLKEKREDPEPEKKKTDYIFSEIPEGILLLDSQLRIQQINTTAMEIFGIHEKVGTIGRQLQEIIRHTEINTFAEKMLAGSFESQNESLYYSIENKYLKLRGRILEKQGDESEILIVLTDITQIRQLENMRRDFVANVSHEIKTPIAAIKGAVETIESGTASSPEDIQKFMKIIVRHTDRLIALIDDLLSLSKIEKQESIDFMEVDLSSILKNIIELCAPKADAKNITLSIKSEDELTAYISPQMFEQALINLVDNAIKYTDTGGNVEVLASKQDTKIYIEVKDNGCGIPEKHLSRLFERFYRVDKARSRKQGGTGLGLAIVKHIVQAHKGSVNVESIPGQGSTFKVAIPRKQKTT